jgi:competence protein ComEA
MRSRNPAIWTLPLWIWAGSIAVAAEKPTLPEGPGKETTQRVCGTCHAAELVMNRRESREGWSGVIEDMIRRGTKGTDEEFGEVADYLVTHFSKSKPLPKININKATEEDLTAALKMPKDQAAAIMKHRETNGDFKSIEDVQKVPGVDASLIEAKKSRLTF